MDPFTPHPRHLTPSPLVYCPRQVCFNISTRSSVRGEQPDEVSSGSLPHIAAFTVWNGNLWGLRRTLLPWMQWSTHLGVCKFYVSSDESR